MLRQAKNVVRIEGILSEKNLEYGSYTSKDTGQPVENIHGSIKIRVNQLINGKEILSEIPVYFFANKYTKAGKLNASYASIEKVMNEYNSIASAGGEAGADKVRVNGERNGNIRMNEYINQTGKLVSFPRIQASFVNHVTGDFNPEASFQVEFALSSMTDELDKDGVPVEPRKVKVNALIPQYGGKLDVIPFYSDNPNVINVIEDYWEPGYTYTMGGRLNFSSTVVKQIEEVGFGEPIEHLRTVSVSELVITGGTKEPLDEEFEFNKEELRTEMAERQARLENLKANPANARGAKRTPAQTSSNSLSDLGF